MILERGASPQCQSFKSAQRARCSHLCISQTPPVFSLHHRPRPARQFSRVPIACRSDQARRQLRDIIMASSMRSSQAPLRLTRLAQTPTLPLTPTRTRAGPQHSRRCFSGTCRRAGYDDTVHNLKIGKHTRVMYQGFTGRVATGNAKDSLAYGTNIVGGVTPGKEGEHIGLPLLPDMRKAKEQLKPDATAVFVAASQCAKAIEDAIEAEIPLIVSVAEHIPVHDMMRVSESTWNGLAQTHADYDSARSQAFSRHNPSLDWLVPMLLESLHQSVSVELVSSRCRPSRPDTLGSLRSRALFLTKRLRPSLALALVRVWSLVWVVTLWLVPILSMP